jgi:hypothetical protein
MSAADQEPERDRQVEAVGVFFQVGWGQSPGRKGANVRYTR